MLVKSCLSSAIAYRHYNLSATSYIFNMFLNKMWDMDQSNERKFCCYAEIMKIIAIMKYKPPGWEKMHDLIDLSDHMESLEIIMLRALTLNMATLDYFHPVLLKKLFDDKFNSANNKSCYIYFLKVLQKIQVSPVYDGPLPTSKHLEMLKDMDQLKYNRSKTMISHLKKILGSENYVKTDLKTKLHHTIGEV